MKNYSNQLAQYLLEGTTSKWLADLWWRKNITAGFKSMGANHMAIAAHNISLGLKVAFAFFLPTTFICALLAFLFHPAFTCGAILFTIFFICVLPSSNDVKTANATKQFLEDSLMMYSIIDHFFNPKDNEDTCGIFRDEVGPESVIMDKEIGRRMFKEILVYFAKKVLEAEHDFGTTSKEAERARADFSKTHTIFNKFFELVEGNHGYYFDIARKEYETTTLATV